MSSGCCPMLEGHVSVCAMPFNVISRYNWPGTHTWVDVSLPRRVTAEGHTLLFPPGTASSKNRGSIPAEPVHASVPCGSRL